MHTTQGFLYDAMVWNCALAFSWLLFIPVNDYSPVQVLLAEYFSGSIDSHPRVVAFHLLEADVVFHY